MQTPQYQLDSLDALQNLPITAPGSGRRRCSAASPTSRARRSATRSSRTTTSSRWSRSTPPRRAATSAPSPPTSRRSSTRPRSACAEGRARSRCSGQVKTMNSAFSGLLFGLLGAIVLIYLLIVVNFQSWSDPVRHHHGAAGRAGRHRLDAVRHRHDAVGAGADRRDHVHGRGDRQQRAGHQLRARAARRSSAMPLAAALEAGFVRFRPVLMTALAMIIGMVPMALGLGEGGEQNAPLGRAVIGGLIFATVATLIFVPVVFSIMHRRRRRRRPPARSENRMPPDATSSARPSSRRAASRLAGHRRLVAGRAPSSSSSGITTRKMADAKLQRMDRERRPCRWSPSPRPIPRGKRTTLDLPGRLEAYSQAPIYARVSGYLKDWKVDIGTPVKAGQLLAEIEAPDLDQQIMQAKADLASAQANADARRRRRCSAARRLITSGAVSKQDLDQRTGDLVQQAGPGQVGAGQPRPAARAREIQAHRRAVRRARDRAHHRRRRADQRRLGGGPALFVVSRHAASCAPTSTCRRTTCRASSSAPRRRSPCRNIRARLSRRRSRPRRSPSMPPPARRACSSSSTMPPAS